jgi:hypothetical protein
MRDADVLLAEPFLKFNSMVRADCQPKYLCASAYYSAESFGFGFGEK